MMEILKELFNSDVFISLEKNSHDIELRFVSTWIPEDGIILKCHNIHSYQFSSDPKRKQPFPLGEVNVYEDVFENRTAEGWSIPSTSDERNWKVWVVDIRGLVEIKIVCLDLQWKIPNEYSLSS